MIVIEHSVSVDERLKGLLPARSGAMRQGRQHGEFRGADGLFRLDHLGDLLGAENDRSQRHSRVAEVDRA
ncbi:hypothetical protein [Actinoallomurus iriomotensis]|uniref:hypothetical protein n=1 Tax=Actinoallomurus iriomotensis TaxID=478107 RepID=UPI002554634B|nr:hypothetical protein [Actinoallomurus iriomotensis]